MFKWFRQWQRRRTLRVIGEERRLHRSADAAAPAVARLQIGAIGELRGCQGGWCRASFGGFEGWLRSDSVYGLLAEERRN